MVVNEQKHDLFYLKSSISIEANTKSKTVQDSFLMPLNSRVLSAATGGWKFFLFLVFQATTATPEAKPNMKEP